MLYANMLYFLCHVFGMPRKISQMSTKDQVLWSLWLHLRPV